MTFEQKKQIVINNSFKVDCNINMTLKEAYEKGFNRGLSKAPNPKVEQPQGEWLKSEKGETIFFCSECGREIDTKPFTRPDNFPFCHCGADMSKGAEALENTQLVR